MNVIGLQMRTLPAFATSAAKRASCVKVAPSFAASASANQKPALWRVAA
jgi:hypothetical protein